MAFIEETDLTVVNRILSNSKARNTRLSIGGDVSMFEDDTFFLKDTRNDGLLAFSLRGEIGDRDTFWEGSYGTTEVSRDGNDRYNAIESLKAVTEAFRIAAIRWPRVPFSGIYSVKCPWIQELVVGKNRDGSDNYRAVDIAIASLESFGVEMVKLDPPQPMKFTSPQGGIVVNLGLVYCHSVPLRVDTRHLNDDLVTR